MSTGTNRPHPDKPFCPDCPECWGEGLTSRYMTFAYRTREITASVTFYCHRCLAGRWMEREHRENHPDLRRRVRDLQEPTCRALQPEELKYPPSMRGPSAADDYVERRREQLRSGTAPTPAAARKSDLPPGVRRLGDALPPIGPNVAELPKAGGAR